MEKSLLPWENIVIQIEQLPHLDDVDKFDKEIQTISLLINVIEDTEIKEALRDLLMVESSKIQR